MPNGASFTQLAKTTWEQMTEQISNDASVCNGGVFWYRDRQSPQPNRARLLSTVSTLQYAFLSIRLYTSTREGAYLEAAKKSYDWTFKAKLIDGGKVYDGTYNPKCWQIEKKEHSYNSGLFLGAAAMLYKTTGEEKYLRDAKAVLSRAQSIFTKDGIIIDECEPNNSCKVNQAAFKGIFVRALGYLYSATNDASMRSAIKSMISKSVQSMSATCNDKWACNVIWTPGAPVYSDVHTQNTALELLNVLCIVADFSTSPISTQVTVPKNSTSSGPKNSTVIDEILLTDSAMAISMVPQLFLLITSLWVM